MRKRKEKVRNRRCQLECLKGNKQVMQMKLNIAPTLPRSTPRANKKLNCKDNTSSQYEVLRRLSHIVTYLRGPVLVKLSLQRKF